MLELIHHYFTIVVFHDYMPIIGGVILEDSPVLDLAYLIAGL